MRTRQRAGKVATRIAAAASRRRAMPPGGALREHDNTWLTAAPSANSSRTALLLLNTPPRPASALRQLWALSSYRVCADAAANRLRDSIQLVMGDTEAMVAGGPAALRERLVRLRRVAKIHEGMVPDALAGDFDSIRPDVLDFYRQRGCQIVHDPSPYSTDFDKALRLVEDVQAATLRTEGVTAQRWTVVAFGAFGDRFDHELSALNVLHRYRNFGRLLLMGERMTACLLGPGRHVLRPSPLIEGPTCGLLPVGGPCEAVWTSGLKWNLRGEPLRFGGLVSSSNAMVPCAQTGRLEVTVTTTHPLIWSTVLRPEGWPDLPPGAADPKGCVLDPEDVTPLPRPDVRDAPTQ
jgi:thiamine pyrophosphokinase